MINRRDAIAMAATEVGLRLLSYGQPAETVLQARICLWNPDSSVWRIGPPGDRLRRFVEKLGEHYVELSAGGPNMVKLWQAAARDALKRPLVFEDGALRGDWFPVDVQLRFCAGRAGVILVIEQR